MTQQLTKPRFKAGDQVRIRSGRGGVWQVVGCLERRPHETEAAYRLSNGRRVRTATESALLRAEAVPG